MLYIQWEAEIIRCQYLLSSCCVNGTGILIKIKWVTKISYDLLVTALISTLIDELLAQTLIDELLAQKCCSK